MTIIYVVEYEDRYTAEVKQFGFALTEAEAEAQCEALHDRVGGNRLDFWVNAYTCKDNEFTHFD